MTNNLQNLPGESAGGICQDVTDACNCQVVKLYVPVRTHIQCHHINLEGVFHHTPIHRHSIAARESDVHVHVSVGHGSKVQLISVPPSTFEDGHRLSIA